MSNTLLEAFERQSHACATLGAPFSAAVLERAGRAIIPGGIVSHLLADWSGVPADRLVRDAVALRLLASLHYLVLSGQAPALAACYPPAAEDPEQAWVTAEQVLIDHAGPVAAILTHEPQTNEVRRSACLLGGFLTIGREARLPLRCFELGASAGLNSLWDAFRYEIGGTIWGDPASSVIVPSRWEGAAPSPDRDLIVAERHACDRRPIDIRQTADATRLLSYCWAEQRERMERLQAAVALGQSGSLVVEAENAARFVERAAPKTGFATVVFHSVVWQYILPVEQAQILATLESHAAAATADAPFFWLRMELNETARQFELRLWSGPGHDRLLAVVHPHGEYAVWQ
ncbi:DUF2332 domain-containing protein [Sphingobium sp. PNB]|uniref:DUF2332 domain-containing protein n=1 Tax=Sphingobium sp. PNB TaxID=863934 RepID=UPI001CA3A105|nr:DUF2332 domain-containing protein [Sphingobium sp. PNB]MCB4859418.1 DUF2332 domain-containing protein [Sphingobium sp. PNB]